MTLMLTLTAEDEMDVLVGHPAITRSHKYPLAPVLLAT